MLRSNSPAPAKLYARSTVDTALRMSQHLSARASPHEAFRVADDNGVDQPRDPRLPGGKATRLELPDLQASRCILRSRVKLAPGTIRRQCKIRLPEQNSNAFWIALFILLTSSLAVPFLLVHEPPLFDYANHLARGFILNHLHDPAFRFAEYYRADWKPYPYVLWDMLLVAFQQLLPAEAAGKLLLILTIVLLPIAVTWFLWQANRSEIKLSFLACALAFNLLFLWGFTAYHLSLGCCFLMMGTWLWYRHQPSLVRAALFGLISFVTYLAHLLGFASAAFILLLYELTSFNWRESLRLAGFLAPPSLLFLWARPGLSEQSNVVMRPLMDKLRSLRDLPTMGYDDRLDQLFLGGLVLCFLIAVVRNRELRVNWRWLVVTVGFLGIFLLLPYGWGTTFDLDVRLVPPLWLLALAVLRVGRRATWIAALAVALIALRVFNISTGFQTEREKSAAMNRGIEHIARNAKVFPLVDTCKDDDPLDDYYVHYWAYSVIRRGAISPYLFDIPGQTPMRITYQPYTPDGYWDHCYDEQPDWKLVAADYDYIWSYGDNRYQRGIEGVAEKVFEENPVILFRVKK